MGKKVNEEEKLERTIRGLLKLAENRRCINCNSLGPQYVCTTFMTFVCTNCSGIHREFTHRIKSVSMAKFTAEEVTALQAGGNERAREIYLKDWDPHRQSLPDSSNLQKLREFIKHVYVHRKYTGERNVDKLPMVKVGNSGSRNSNLEVGREWHNSERSSPGGRSSDRNIRYYYDERRSPRFSHEHSRSSGSRRNPVRFEVVDDRVRDNGVGGGRRTESNKFSSGESRQVSRLPDSQRKVNASSYPGVRPLSNLLGGNVSPIHVAELPDANDRKGADASAHVKKISFSSSIGLMEGHPAEPRMANSGSLIDLSTNPDPPDAAAVSQTQPAPSSTNIENLASGGVSSENKASHSPSINIFDSLLSELSVPEVVPICNISEGLSGGNMVMTQTVGVSSTLPPPNMLELPNNNGAPTSISMINTSLVIPSEGAPAASQVEKLPVFAGESGDSIDEVPQPSASPSVATSSISQQTSQLDGILQSQPRTSSFVSNMQGPFSTSEKSFQSVSKLGQGISAPVGSQPPLVEAKPSGRMELPVDLFTATYSPNPSPFQGWQAGSPYNMGFGMQSHPAATITPAFPSSVKSTNPFDFNDETTEVQAPAFPSMESMQRALPRVSAPVEILRASSLGALPPMMQPHSPSYASPIPPQSPYALAMSTSPYARPRVPNTMLAPRQGIGSINSGSTVFSFANTNQLPAGRHSEPATPDPFSSLGVNPFR